MRLLSKKKIRSKLRKIVDPLTKERNYDRNMNVRWSKCG